eukprot:gene9165-1253_t
METSNTFEIVQFLNSNSTKLHLDVSTTTCNILAFIFKTKLNNEETLFLLIKEFINFQILSKKMFLEKLTQETEGKIDLKIISRLDHENIISTSEIFFELDRMGYLNNFIDILSHSVNETNGFDVQVLKELIESDKSSRVFQKFLKTIRWKVNDEEKNKYLKLYLNVLKTSTLSKKSDFLLREFKQLISTDASNFKGIFKYVNGEYPSNSSICDSIISEFLQLQQSDLVGVIKSKLMSDEVNWGILISFLQKIDSEIVLSILSDLTSISIQVESINDIVVMIILSRFPSGKLEDSNKYETWMKENILSSFYLKGVNTNKSSSTSQFIISTLSSMISQESPKYLNVIKHLLEYSSKMKNLVTQYVLEAKQHLRKTSLIGDVTASQIKYSVYYPQIETALEEFKELKKIPDSLKKKSKSILESRSFEMNFLPALLEYQPKERSTYNHYKINFIQELLNEGLIPSSISEKFENIISLEKEETETDYHSEKNEIISSMEFFSQNVSQSSNWELKDMILYISEKIKKFLKNHLNTKDEIKKLVKQIFNELSNSLYKDLQENHKIRDWIEFSMKELFESYSSLHESLFEIIIELMNQLDSLNEFQKKALSLYLCYMCAGDGLSSLNKLAEKSFENLSCNDKNHSSIVEFLTFFINECLHFDEIVTNNWSQKFILNEIQHRKSCFIPQICLQKINYIHQNLNHFSENMNVNNFKKSIKKIHKLLKETSSFNLAQWIKCELSFNFTHSSDYYKEKLISNYLSEFNYKISELTKSTFQNFVINSIDFEFNNQNANFLLLSNFMIYFEMNNEKTSSMWILEEIQNSLKNTVVSKSRFHQIFSVLNSIYPQILFLEVKSTEESKNILERIHKFVDDFKIFYPFSDSFISLVLQGIHFLSNKRNISFESTYLMEQLESKPLLYVSIVKKWNKHSSMFHLMGDSFKLLKNYFDSITTVLEEFGINELFDNSKLLNFIEKQPKFFSFVFFESITHEILTESNDEYNFGLSNSSSDFIRILFRFFNYLKTIKMSINLKVFLNSFFKLCIQNNLTDIYIFVQKSIGEDESFLTFSEFTPEKKENDHFIDRLMLKLLDLFPDLFYIFNESFEEFFSKTEMKLWNNCLVFSFLFKFNVLNERSIESISGEEKFKNTVSNFYSKFKQIQKISSMFYQKNEILKKINSKIKLIPQLKPLIE